MKDYIFETTLNSSHSIVVPEEIADDIIKLGFKRVVVHIMYQDKSIQYHAALQKYLGDYHITFNKQNQQKLGVVPSAYFKVTLSEDSSKYGVEMPEEFEAVLYSDPESYEIFESLTDGKKRSLIYYILKIKSSQKRIDKSLIIAENLKRGIRDSKILVKKMSGSG